MRIAAGLLLALAVLAYALWTPDRDRASLEAKYLRAPSDLRQVDGVTLHVRDDGPRAAPALLLIHGFGSSLHTWETWAGQLVASHRVIRFDLPGNGLSSPDPSGDYSDPRTIALIIALLDQLGVTKTAVLGNSIGGRIAWRFAAAHPERLSKLILVSPDGFASPGFDYGKAPDVPLMVEAMRWTLPKWLLKPSLAPAYVDRSVMTDALTTRYHELMLGPGARGAMIARMAQTVLVDPRPLLRSITAPTLLLWGEQDQLIPFANSADYLAALPNARLVPLPRIGHLPQEEAPLRTLQPLASFLAESVPPDSGVELVSASDTAAAGRREKQSLEGAE